MASRGKRKSLYSTESAKKRAKKQQDSLRQQSRIYIKDHWDRWCIVKARYDLKTHGEVAGFLLDWYERRGTESRPALTSTPGFVFRKPGEPPVSSITGSDTVTASAMSGVDPMQGSEQKESGGSHSSEVPGHLDPPCLQERVFSSMQSSTEDDADPFGLVAAAEKEQSYQLEDSDENDETSDDDGDVSCYNSDDTEDQNLDTTILDIEEEESDDSDTETYYSIRAEGVARVKSPEDILGDKATITYESSLRVLADSAPRGGCDVTNCGMPFEIITRRRGTALYFTWICQNKHVGYTWCSQPKMRARGVHAGDFLLATNILLSGNNYTKVALMCRFLNIGVVSASLFDQIQTLYCCPSINTYWEALLTSTLEKYKDQDLIVAGDGRNDSPGHCAQYCTYTLMHHDTREIVSLVVVDKREVRLKSPNMEKLALEKSLKGLQEKGFNVKELVTDAHVQIGAMMKKDYPNTFHSWDVWHGSKNFGKKVTAAATEKNCKDLAPWVKATVNHFWFCSKMAEGSIARFMARWRGVLQHVVNTHEWALGDGGGPGECEHGELPEDRDKDWLQPDSPSHIKLRNLVLDKRMINNNIPHYVNFRHTGDLEVFHNHILMYAAKRFSFSFITYRARIQLAAIDYQKHLGRPTKKDKEGNDMFRGVYNKRSVEWNAKPIKVPKKYEYIVEIQKLVVQDCLSDNRPMHRKRELLPEDPRRIQSNLAAIPAPSTSDLIAKHKSRFSTEPSLPRAEKASSSTS